MPNLHSNKMPHIEESPICPSKLDHWLSALSDAVAQQDTIIIRLGIATEPLRTQDDCSDIKGSERHQWGSSILAKQLQELHDSVIQNNVKINSIIEELEYT